MRCSSRRTSSGSTGGGPGCAGGGAGGGGAPWARAHGIAAKKKRSVADAAQERRAMNGRMTDPSPFEGTIREAWPLKHLSGQATSRGLHEGSAARSCAGASPDARGRAAKHGRAERALLRRDAERTERWSAGILPARRRRSILGVGVRALRERARRTAPRRARRSRAAARTSRRRATHGRDVLARVELEVQREHVDARLAEEAQRRRLGVRRTSTRTSASASAARLGDARDLDLGRGERDVRVEPAARSWSRGRRDGRP